MVREDHVCFGRYNDPYWIFSRLPERAFDRLVLRKHTYEDIMERLGLERVGGVADLLIKSVQAEEECDSRAFRLFHMYGDLREEIIGNLGRDVAGCGRCMRDYRSYLRTRVESEDYGSIEEADKDHLHIGFNLHADLS